jgi:hypothetical protein
MKPSTPQLPPPATINHIIRGRPVVRRIGPYQTLTEAAALTGVSRHTIYNPMGRGRLHPIRLRLRGADPRTIPRATDPMARGNREPLAGGRSKTPRRLLAAASVPSRGQRRARSPAQRRSPPTPGSPPTPRISRSSSRKSASPSLREAGRSSRPTPMSPQEPARTELTFAGSWPMPPADSSAGSSSSASTGPP